MFKITVLLLLLSRFSRVRLCVTPWLQPTRLLHSWDSPGKNTGVGCQFLLQCMKVKSESEVAQSCLTFSDPMDYNPPGSSVHGIFQARTLEWGAIAFSVYSGRKYQNWFLCLFTWTCRVEYIEGENYLSFYNSSISCQFIETVLFFFFFLLYFTLQYCIGLTIPHYVLGMSLELEIKWWRQ